MSKISPSLNNFLSAIEKKKNQIIWTVLKSDLNTPVSVFKKLAHSKKNNFLLESVHDGSYRGRYSVIGLEPDLIWKCKNGKAEVMVNDNGYISQKMYDISPEAIMDNKILGNIAEIDKIHNGHVQNSMSFDRMMLNHFQNTTGRLHTTINPLVLSYHSRTLKDDLFFNPKKN